MSSHSRSGGRRPVRRATSTKRIGSGASSNLPAGECATRRGGGGAPAPRGAAGGPCGARLRRSGSAPGRARICRLGSARRGGRVPARASTVTRELVYGRNAARELYRGPRQVLETWVTERAESQIPWVGARAAGQGQ